MAHSQSNFEGLPGVQITGPILPGFDTILTPEAVSFVAGLVREFAPRVPALLNARKERQARFDAGERPDFLTETKAIRDGDWKVAPLPKDLLDRRVEITGPVDRKMVINALNSGASCFMADFEDANSPTWENCISGQVNLRDAVRGTISYVAPETGKAYSLAPKTATLLVRPRGWHLYEKHVVVDGKVAPGGIVDFGLYFFHNAKAALAKGTGPYFYLPKMQSHLEARLWNDIFVAAQTTLGIPQGTIKGTVLIETLPAAFEMDEILYELREHSSGLNCGRWDYMFSYIKVVKNDPAFVIPDRSQVTMTQHFLRSYSQLLIKTCHRRGVHAMGGMAAFIPVKNDPALNDKAMAQVKADKEREAGDGHDGTWVAHPGLVPVAREIFDRKLGDKPNQLDVLRADVSVTAADLLAVPTGTKSEDGLRHNIKVGVQYLESWLRGVGCVPLYNLMEDAATAEISRTQVWQWLRHGAVLDAPGGGHALTVERFDQVLDEEMLKIKAEIGEARFNGGKFTDAKRIFRELSVTKDFIEFLTLPAYEMLG
jgi:malate synthase